MTNQNQHSSFALLVPAVIFETQPLLFAGGFWSSPWGFPKLVNLLIFLGILYYLLRKPAKEFFAQRLASVREMLEKAAREKEEATTKMADLEARLNRLDADIAEIKAQSEREAAAERERLEAEAKKDIERFRLSAQREIEVAKQVAMADLQEFAAAKAVDLAEQMIRREMTPADDARMLDRVGQELSKAR
jgi:F-type H+-transporting ATPase subunit b